MNNNLQELSNFFNNAQNSFCLEYIFINETETKNFAYKFASLLKENDIVVLNGELGSGKTVFMSGIASYFNIENQVSSPTFTIVNEYSLNNTKKIFHFDVYRLEDSNEFINKVGTEYFDDGISIIEWGDIIKDILPKRTIFIDILKDKKDPNIRKFIIKRGVK